MAKRGQTGRRKRVVEKKRRGRKAETAPEATEAVDASEVVQEAQDAQDASESSEPAAKKAKAMDQFLCFDIDDDDFTAPPGVTLHIQNPESVEESKEEVKQEVIEEILKLKEEFDECVKKEDPETDYQEINATEAMEIDKMITEFEETVKKEEEADNGEFCMQDTQEISLTANAEPLQPKSCMKTPVKKAAQRRVSFVEDVSFFGYLKIRKTIRISGYFRPKPVKFRIRFTLETYLFSF